MSVLQKRYCPRCQAKTYQRFTCSLRDRFAGAAHWKCIECGSRNVPVTPEDEARQSQHCA